MNVKIYFQVLALAITPWAAGQSSFTLMGARAAGLGYTSAVLDDEWALFNNVAGIAGVGQASTAFAFEVRPALTGANRTAASIVVPAKIATVGVGLFRFGDEVYSQQVLSFGVGNKIGNSSLGVKTNYIQYQAEGFGTTTALTVDFGGITRITPQFSVGAYITNLTQSKLMSSDDDRLPTKLVVGLGFRPTEKIAIGTEIEKDINYGATWRSGLEYSIYRKVFFRTGFNLNPDAAYFGLGAQKKNLKFDYGIRFNLLTGTSHQASAIYRIPAKNRK